MALPLLYSFRRCPYAIRARMALRSSKIIVKSQEVDLKKKPKKLLRYSPKGTVPVLILADKIVIEESLDIMRWSLKQHDPDNWLSRKQATLSQALIHINDTQFKPVLDQYKYAERFPQKTQDDYRAQCEIFLLSLERLLSHQRYLLSSKPMLVDVAIFPFIRQFAFVNKPWFDQTTYPKLQQWLQYFLDLPLFKTVMLKTNA